MTARHGRWQQASRQLEAALQRRTCPGHAHTTGSVCKRSPGALSPGAPFWFAASKKERKGSAWASQLKPSPPERLEQNDRSGAQNKRTAALACCGAADRAVLLARCGWPGMPASRTRPHQALHAPCRQQQLLQEGTSATAAPDVSMVHGGVAHASRRATILTLCPLPPSAARSPPSPPARDSMLPAMVTVSAYTSRSLPVGGTVTPAPAQGQRGERTGEAAAADELQTHVMQQQEQQQQESRMLNTRHRARQQCTPGVFDSVTAAPLVMTTGCAKQPAHRLAATSRSSASERGAAGALRRRGMPPASRGQGVQYSVLSTGPWEFQSRTGGTRCPCSTAIDGTRLDTCDRVATCARRRNLAR